jgi:hypothetical protein
LLENYAITEQFTMHPEVAEENSELATINHGLVITGSFESFGFEENNSAITVPCFELVEVVTLPLDALMNSKSFKTKIYQVERLASKLIGDSK